MKKVQARWLVSLSDGTTAIEGKTPYEEINGQLSPWQRLIQHISTNNLSITAIRIELEIEKDGQIFTHHYNLPSKSPKQKWANLKPILPTHFDYHRRVSLELGNATVNDKGGLDVKPLGETHYIEITAYFPHFNLMILVDEDNASESWSIIVPKETQ